jgi:hypothetical protein
MRDATPMQFSVAVVTRIMAMFVAMAMFVSVGVAMWVRMHDVTMPVLVGMFVRMLV